ncbi:phage tail length tape measure family protein [Sphingomonas bacterium]|uniref:phage tail length tape measure family protein n=1 Tax=Sphingomonas bacterium TaxID=1895847 RepID=UPI001576220B|nr:phage tail length tape measure family protein [Sphingomonas bacterium]
MGNSVGIRLAVDNGDGKKALVDLSDTGDAQAKRLVRSYDQATDDLIAADRRRAQATEKLAAIAPNTQTQQIYQAGASTNYGGQSARDAAADFRELLAAQEDLEARATSLKAKLDPLHDAQAKYDAEIKNAAELLAANLIGEAEHEKAVSNSAKALNAAKKELGDHSSALSFNRQQFIIGQSAAMRFSDSVMAGASPIKAAALEAHKLGEVLSVDDGGVAGGLAKVRAILNPTALAITAGAIVMTAAAVAAISYGDAIGKLNALAEGSGRALGQSGAQLEANAEAAAAAGNTTVSAARDIEAGYLSVAKSGDVLVGLTAITKDFAAATGQDAKGAQQELAAAFADPIHGADDLAQKYGLLTQAQAERIDKLVEEGRQEEAQKLQLGLLIQAIGGASDKAEGLAASWDHIKNSIDRAWTSAGRFFNTYGDAAVHLFSGSPQFIPFAPDPANSAAASAAAANQARARASAISDSYRGDNTDTFQRTIGTLQAGIKAGGNAEQMQQWTTALAANQHALDTWVPAQQKANDVAEAQDRLANARGKSAKAAAERALVLAQAQGTVATSADIEAQAHARADAAAGRATKTGDKHAQTLAREAESMEVAAKASLTLADAYLDGSSQGLVAEARRKAATDATKKGIDVEAQTRRQLALTVAEGIATGAKSVSSLDAENAARAAVIAKIASGKLSASQANDVLADEATLRPLLTLAAIAEGDAKKELTKVIERQTAALKQQRIEQEQLAAASATQAANDNAAGSRDQAAIAGDFSDGAKLALARRTAERQAATQYSHLDASDPIRTGFVQAQVGSEQAKLDADHATASASALRDQSDQNALIQTQIGLLGKSADAQEQATSHLQLQQQLARTLGDDYAKYAPAILAGADAEVKSQEKLRLLQGTWSEIRSAGDQFLEDLTNPDGSGIKRLLGDIEQEFIKLAALNPLKNLLLGEKNPTLGGVLGSLLGKSASLFGNIDTSGVTGITDPGDIVGHVDPLSAFGSAARNASGTEYFSGGQTWLAENGPELVTLPTGSKVTSAPATRRMLAGDGGGGDTHNHYYIEGNLLTPEFWGQIQSMDDSAATRGAAGGAQLAQTKAAKSARYRIPGR